jgi:hypothetical protein
LDYLDQHVVIVDPITGAKHEVSKPGDYGILTGMLGWRGDSAIIVDGGLGKYKVMAATGGVGRSLEVPPGPAIGKPQFADTIGRLYAVGWSARDSTAQKGGARMPILRWSERLGRKDTVGFLPVANRPDGLLRDGQMGPVAIPFWEWPAMAVSPGGLVATIEPPYTVTVGQASRVIPYARIRLGEKDKEQWRARAREGNPSIVSTDNGWAVRRIHRPFEEPATWPAVLPPAVTQSIRFDWLNRLWVQKYVAPDAAPQWDVFSADAKLAMTVLIPSADRIVGFGRRRAFIAIRRSDGREFVGWCEVPH